MHQPNLLFFSNEYLFDLLAEETVNTNPELALEMYQELSQEDSSLTWEEFLQNFGETNHD